MAGKEETKEVQSPFNFWEYIEMLESDHKLEIMELKERLEEEGAEVARLQMELEKKENARTEAEVKADFWMRMNKVTEKVMIMKTKVAKHLNEVVPEKDSSFLEKVQKNPGRKKKQPKQRNKNPVKTQQCPMSLMKIPMTSQKNVVVNLKNQAANQMTTHAMMTLTIPFPAVASM